MRKPTEYLAVIEEGPTSFGAYVPDLPGVVAAGATREECERLIQDAIAFHIEGLVEFGEPVPAAHTTTLTVSYPPAAA